ncbi:MAG TPA: hypothetical protein VMZ52_02290 [Bryobacteraceae bacterium]|nr:hypothetical protein [Bryobacteraceae bacterium]
MSFLAILRKFGLIAGLAAPEVISLVNPPLGALIGTVLTSVLLAESRLGPGNGALKKEESLNSIQVAAPLMVHIVESATRKSMMDPVLFTSGVEKLSDGIVDVLNSFRILPKTGPALPLVK